MSHSIEYQGPYDYNIFRVRTKPHGPRRYLKRDGKRTARYRGPNSVDGIVFGMLELPGKEFRIVRIEAQGNSVVLNIPIKVGGTGPNGTRLGLTKARALLKKARFANPRQPGPWRHFRKLLDR